MSGLEQFVEPQGSGSRHSAVSPKLGYQVHLNDVRIVYWSDKPLLVKRRFLSLFLVEQISQIERALVLVWLVKVATLCRLNFR
jgi:hypothetical protein